MFDVIFYYKSDKSEIVEYCNIPNIPTVKDYVILDKHKYIVDEVIYDYDKKRIHIFMTKATSNDTTFL